MSLSLDFISTLMKERREPIMWMIIKIKSILSFRAQFFKLIPKRQLCFTFYVQVKKQNKAKQKGRLRPELILDLNCIHVLCAHTVYMTTSMLIGRVHRRSCCPNASHYSIHGIYACFQPFSSKRCYV